jgi:hypothetical protein
VTCIPGRSGEAVGTHSNGKLDTNMMGIPREGVGASNGAKGHFGLPKFDASAFPHVPRLMSWRFARRWSGYREPVERTLAQRARIHPTRIPRGLRQAIADAIARNATASTLPKR